MVGFASRERARRERLRKEQTKNGLVKETTGRQQSSQYFRVSNVSTKKKKKRKKKRIIKTSTEKILVRDLDDRCGERWMERWGDGLWRRKRNAEGCQER